MTVTSSAMGNTTERLGWRPVHDSRSLDYPIRSILGAPIESPRTWRRGPILDQGREGACVGFAWTNELIASPLPDPKTDITKAQRYALNLYREAQRIDEWPGENYDGTSVLAGAKIVKGAGLIKEYRWAFNIDDVKDTVIQHGPVVIGIPWYESMYDTRKSGLVEVGGPLVGGHALMVFGYHPAMRIRGEGWNERHRVFKWYNSWGPSYGKRGYGYVRYEDLRDLLKEWGEACVPMSRQFVRL